MSKVCGAGYIDPKDVMKEARCGREHKCNRVILYRENKAKDKPESVRFIRASDCILQNYAAFEEIPPLKD